MPGATVEAQAQRELHDGAKDELQPHRHQAVRLVRADERGQEHGGDQRQAQQQTGQHRGKVARYAEDAAVIQRLQAAVRAWRVAGVADGAQQGGGSLPGRRVCQFGGQCDAG